MGVLSTKLIASVSGSSTDELVRLATRGCEGADLIELRVDGIDRPDLARLRKDVDSPTVLTCRSAKQGGAFEGSESERLLLLENATKIGFDYVDIEIDALREPLSETSAKLIMSHHDFEGLPEESERVGLIARALELGADVIKIAARVTSLAEALELARLGEDLDKEGVAFVPVPMGPAGVFARILANKLGAAFSYASARGAPATGPAQVSLDDMLSLYRFPSIGPHTEIYGILGTQALESRSPAMHNAFFERLGKDAVYVPFQEERLDDFVRSAKALGVSGLSITLPFKRAILPHLDKVDARASEIGAVNTVVVRDGVWTGYNTDRDGVLTPLSAKGDWSQKSAVLVGAGGAARAAAYALFDLGVVLRVLARDEARAKELADRFGAASGALDELPELSWDLLVNATPLGSSGESVPVGAIAEGALVFDMVTVPERTPLIATARVSGAATITGIEMLAAQAVHQAELWTGERPSREDMEASARGDAVASRYLRQVLFSEIGEEGQRSIGAKRVLVVGVGALGSVSSEMITRAGVASVRIVDRDYVDESNLQRQSLFDEDDWRQGLPKAIAAARKLSRINSDVHVEAIVADVHAGNVSSLFRGVDLVLDGTDNFETRYLLNDASVESGVAWIYAACVGSYGMSFVVIPGRTPCLRCFMEEEPAPGTSPTCDTAGVIAPIVHAVAGFQVSEALKILAGREDALHGEVLSLDVWRGRVDAFRPARARENCPACGRHELSYLMGEKGGQAVTLCGRNAVQVRPSKSQTMELDAVAQRLRGLGEVKVNDHLLRVKLAEHEIVLFKDGRAIVHGTEDPAEARSLYARYVGT